MSCSITLIDVCHALYGDRRMSCSVWRSSEQRYRNDYGGFDPFSCMSVLSEIFGLGNFCLSFCQSKLRNCRNGVLVYSLYEMLAEKWCLAENVMPHEVSFVRG